MPARYHRFAGSSLDRLGALSDGVFAVAMTLLVLNLGAPATRGAGHHLVHYLLHTTASHLLPYAMSFLTLGIFWVGQQAQFESFTRSTRALTWIHIAFLFAVTLLPFSTRLIAENPTYRAPVAVYWLNLFLLGVVLFASLRYADRTGLFGEETTADMRAALERRIVVYQALYALAAVTCLIDSYVAIGLIVALQLNAVISPRIWILDRA
jgi:uncharacterized membrane protein